MCTVYWPFFSSQPHLVKFHHCLKVKQKEIEVIRRSLMGFSNTIYPILADNVDTVSEALIEINNQCVEEYYTEKKNRR